MTNEELKEEAEEKAKKRTKGFKYQDNCEKSYVMGALDFAEPREKRIAELEERISNQGESLRVTMFEEEKKEKRIAELEKENAELRKDNKALREKVHWWKKEVNVAHRSRADEMDKLIIDNRGLKGQIDKWLRENTGLKIHCAYVEKKLTEAKEILERLMDIINHDLKCFDTMAGLDVKQKAEQFISEVRNG